jgi:hypothetical protein
MARRVGWVALLLWMAAVVAAPSLATAEESSRGIDTNLALLRRLLQSALTQALDSLSLPRNRPVYIQPAGFHETNWLVAESLAQLLRQRGYRPVLLEESAASAAEAETGQPPAVEEAAPEEEPEVTIPLEPVSDLEDTTGVEVEGPEEEGWTDEEEDFLAEETTETEMESAPEDTTAPRSGPAVRWSPSEEEEAARVREPRVPAKRPAAGSQIRGDVLRFRVVELGVTYPSARRSLLFVGPQTITRLAGAHIRLTHLREPEGEVQGVGFGEAHVVDRFPGSLRPFVEGPQYPFTRPETRPPGWSRLVEPAVVVAIVSALVYLFYANQS